MEMRRLRYQALARRITTMVSTAMCGDRRITLAMCLSGVVVTGLCLLLPENKGARTDRGRLSQSSPQSCAAEERPSKRSACPEMI